MKSTVEEGVYSIPQILSDLLSLVPLEIFSSSLLVFLSFLLAGAFRKSLCGRVYVHLLLSRLLPCERRNTGLEMTY